jgi:nucleoside-diphosphate-sugar epimerase
VGVADPFLALDTALRHNLYGTINLLRAAFGSFEEGAPPARVIVARTPGELTSMNHYAASKAAAWQICRMYARTQGWPIYGAMIFQAYGPGQPAHSLIPSAIRSARLGQDFPMTGGTQERDWIYVGDVAEGLNAALGADLEPGCTFDLGTGQATSLVEVVQEIYRQIGLGGEPRPGVLPSRQGEEARQLGDANKTARLINWRPTVPLSEGLLLTGKALEGEFAGSSAAATGQRFANG